MFEDDIRRFIQLCSRPAMIGQLPSYETVCAFIDGFSTARGGAPLEGFREFLLTEGTRWSNAPWWAILRMRVLPDGDFNSGLGSAEEEEARKRLAAALERYLRVRQEGGVGLVFHIYNTWLLSMPDPALASHKAKLQRYAAIATPEDSA